MFLFWIKREKTLASRLALSSILFWYCQEKRKKKHLKDNQTENKEKGEKKCDKYPTLLYFFVKILISFLGATKNNLTSSELEVFQFYDFFSIFLLLPTQFLLLQITFSRGAIMCSDADIMREWERLEQMREWGQIIAVPCDCCSKGYTAVNWGSSTAGAQFIQQCCHNGGA